MLKPKITTIFIDSTKLVFKESGSVFHLNIEGTYHCGHSIGERSEWKIEGDLLKFKHDDQSYWTSWFNNRDDREELNKFCVELINAWLHCEEIILGT